MFLRDTFGLPVGARAVHAPEGGARQSSRPGQPAAPVIPLRGEAVPEVALPHWPRMGADAFETLMTRVEKRIQAALPRLLMSHTASVRLRAIGFLVLLFGRDKVLQVVRLSILSDLVRRDQIEGWSLPPELTSGEGPGGQAVRAVLAELAAPGFDYRTAVGIGRATHLAVPLVQSILDALRGAKGNLAVVTAPERSALYTLAIRRSRGFWALPGLAWLGRSLIRRGPTCE